MKIPPNYVFTAQISFYLQSIEACRAVIDAVSVPIEIENNIRRSSSLKSSLFSARIEGNPLTLDDLGQRSSGDLKRKEVFNILRGLHVVSERGARDLTNAVILRLHECVLEGLADSGEGGNYRREVSAIFNSAGIAVYMPPLPRQISGLMERLIKFANSDRERFVPIKAVIVHYLFEKTHPFLDGNGRVGRLLLSLMLEKGGYGMKQLLSIEEYLYTHRGRYYSALELGENDITGFVEFMLEAIAETAEKAKNEVLAREKVSAEDYLLPRRAEIFHIIQDHKLVNFDQIRRRFMKINERTLRFDLKKLVDAGLVKKRGSTKGVYYEIIENG